MNMDRHHIRLDDLWAEITQLEAAVVDLERAAGDMLGGEDKCVAAMAREAETKAALNRALREHAILAHFVLTVQRKAAA